jgi:hypothetical protein
VLTILGSAAGALDTLDIRPKSAARGSTRRTGFDRPAKRWGQISDRLSVAGGA